MVRSGNRRRLAALLPVGVFSALLAGSPTVGASPEAVCAVVDQVTVSAGGQNVNVSYDGDGSRMAFVSNRDYVGTNPDGNNEIFVYDVAAAAFTQVTTTSGSGGVNVPSISADGQRVAFQSNKNLTGSNGDANNEIFLWDATGSTLTQITTSGSTRTNAAPKISADGTRVAFSSDADLTGGNADTNQEIYVWAIAGAVTTQVTTTSGGINGSPTISADGTKVAFRSNRDIGGANSEANNEVFLWSSTGPTTTPVTATASGSSDGPSISSDGTQIAFRSTANLGGGNADANQEVFLWRSAGPTTTQITATTGGSSDGVSLAADGSRMAFKSSRDLTGANSDLTNEIFAWDETGGITQLTDTPIGGGGNRAPVIAGNGSSIAFESDRDVTGGNSDRNYEIFRTACGLDVTKTAGAPNAVVGGSIDYQITVANNGAFTLTGGYLDDPNAPACSSTLADLGPGQSVTVDCEYTPTIADVGTYANVATVDADQSPPVASNAVEVSVGYPAGTGALAGRVTEQGIGAPLSSVWVALLRASDFSVVGGAVTDGDGAYAALLPTGSYYLYLVDPSRGHLAGFSGVPTPVAVVNGASAVADRAMASMRGQITGSVTEEGTGDPLDGAVVLSIGGPTTSPEGGVLTDVAGAFAFDGLPVGNHWVGYVDPTGAHTAEFYPNSPSVPAATAVVVTGGGSAAADASLTPQVVTPGGAALSGIVSESGSADALGNVLVAALRAADYRLVRATITDGSGGYVFDLIGGEYRLAFVDLSGRHRMEWFDGQPNTGLAESLAVAAPGSASASLDLVAGALAGTVTDDTSGDPVADAWVVAIGPSGAIAGGAVTAPDGSFSIADLPAGTYRATYVDPVGGRLQEYWPDSPSYAGGSDLVVAGGATTIADAALGGP